MQWTLLLTLASATLGSHHLTTQERHLQRLEHSKRELNQAAIHARAVANRATEHVMALGKLRQQGKLPGGQQVAKLLDMVKTQSTMVGAHTIKEYPMGVIALAEEVARVDPPKDSAAKEAFNNNLAKIKSMAVEMQNKESEMLHHLASIPGAPKDLAEQVENYDHKSHQSLMQDRDQIREQLIQEAHEYRRGYRD